MTESGNARCPVCRQVTSVAAGEPVPPHQPPDSRETCTGSNQPATD